MTQTEATTRDDSRRMQGYVAAFSASAIGNGLVLPLTVLYLSLEGGLTPGQLSAYYAVLAGIALLVNPVAGSTVDRIGARPVVLAAVVGQALGWVWLSVPQGWPGPLVAASLIGAANSFFFAGQLALLRAMFGQEQLGRIFSQQYRISNLVLAVPVLFAGALGTLAGSGIMRWLVLANGLTFLAFGAALAFLSRDVGSLRRPPDQPATGSALTPYRDPHFQPVLVMQFCMIGFAVAQLDTVIPALLADSAGAAALKVSVLIGVNCVLVFAMGGRARDYVERVGHARAMAFSFVAWAATLVPLALCLASPDSWLQWVWLVVYAVAFSVPEAIAAPTLKPLAAIVAPDGMIGRYASALSMVYSVGLFVGPPLALAVSGVSTMLVYAVLLVTMALGCVAAQRATTTSTAGEVS